MGLTTIENGQDPDATVLMANFNFLAGGAGIKRDTFANLRVAAAAAPTTPFLCIASAPDNLFMLYWGDVTVGDGGFTVLASGGTIV